MFNSRTLIMKKKINVKNKIERIARSPKGPRPVASTWSHRPKFESKHLNAVKTPQAEIGNNR